MGHARTQNTVQPPWLRWTEGRQGTGYRKLRLASAWLPRGCRLGRVVGFDVYILHYPDGAAIPEHQDPVAIGLEHHRVNVVLRSPRAGGEFVCAGGRRLWGRGYYFRPDTMRHAVRTCEGDRWVLSMGWVREKKSARLSQ